MKKLITICLIMAATFAANAQKKELNKEETVAYIETLWKSSYYDEHGPISFQADGRTIKTLCYSQYKKINVKESHIISSTTTFEIFDFKPTYAPKNYNIRIWVGNEEDVIFSGISTYEDASRLKRALEHLQKLLINDKSDPFGN